MNATNAVVAVGPSLALVHLQSVGHEGLTCEVVRLPDFHSDTIRELKVNPANLVRDCAGLLSLLLCKCRPR